mmetsp:Transcript_58286/g.138880  ORF Transcript_58286/g.138880 Transcript_58286/m.138880 type:complete len:740 (-) Transcript_58286:172-2391(-)
MQGVGDVHSNYSSDSEGDTLKSSSRFKQWWIASTSPSYLTSSLSRRDLWLICLPLPACVPVLEDVAAHFNVFGDMEPRGERLPIDIAILFLVAALSLLPRRMLIADMAITASYCFFSVAQKVLTPEPSPAMDTLTILALAISGVHSLGVATLVAFNLCCTSLLHINEDTLDLAHGLVACFVLLAAITLEHRCGQVSIHVMSSRGSYEALLWSLDSASSRTTGLLDMDSRNEDASTAASRMSVLLAPAQIASYVKDLLGRSRKDAAPDPMESRQYFTRVSLNDSNEVPVPKAASHKVDNFDGEREDDIPGPATPLVSEYTGLSPEATMVTETSQGMGGWIFSPVQASQPGGDSGGALWMTTLLQSLRLGGTSSDKASNHPSRSSRASSFAWQDTPAPRYYARDTDASPPPDDPEPVPPERTNRERPMRPVNVSRHKWTNAPAAEAYIPMVPDAEDNFLEIDRIQEALAKNPGPPPPERKPFRAEDFETAEETSLGKIPVPKATIRMRSRTPEGRGPAPPSVLPKASPAIPEDLSTGPPTRGRSGGPGRPAAPEQVAKPGLGSSNGAAKPAAAGALAAASSSSTTPAPPPRAVSNSESPETRSAAQSKAQPKPQSQQQKGVRRGLQMGGFQKSSLNTIFVERSEPEFRVNGRETYWSVQESHLLFFSTSIGVWSFTQARTFPQVKAGEWCSIAHGPKGLDVAAPDAVKVKKGWREWDRQANGWMERDNAGIASVGKVRPQQ